MLTRFLGLIVLLALSTGCGLRAQTYVMDKPRVGIEKGSGNAGYLSGTPVFVEPEKRTRKVYVLEITKAIPESEAKKIEQETSMVTQTAVEIPAAAPAASASAPSEHGSNKIVIPKIEEESASSATPMTAEKAIEGPKGTTTYTVQKDDTLQKIAKKYYGTYSAWLKIYNANKEKIKNPNFVRPGTVLTLPAAK
jgi:nucleoid-associated protein YgaU